MAHLKNMSLVQNFLSRVDFFTICIRASKKFQATQLYSVFSLIPLELSNTQSS